MKIVITLGELINRGLWESYCALMDFDYYAAADGRIGENKEFILTEEQFKALGFYIFEKNAK